MACVVPPVVRSNPIWQLLTKGDTKTNENPHEHHEVWRNRRGLDVLVTPCQVQPEEELGQMTV